MGIPLKRSLQPMQTHYLAVLHYWNCQHSNPSAVQSVQANFGVEDEANLAIETKGPDPFQRGP